MFRGEFVDNPWPKRLYHRCRKVRILTTGCGCIDHSTEMVHPNAEMPLTRPNAGEIQTAFVVFESGKFVRQQFENMIFSGPLLEECSSNHSVKDTRISRQILAKSRCRINDIDDQI